MFLRKNQKNHGNGRREDLGTAHFFCRLLPSPFFGLKPGRSPPSRLVVFPGRSPSPLSLLSRPKPPLACDFRELAMLKCEPDVSLLLAGPPVPPVLALFLARLCPDCRAAPHARARSDLLGGVPEAAVVSQQQRPRRIVESGLADVIQESPYIFLLDPL